MRVHSVARVAAHRLNGQQHCDERRERAEARVQRQSAQCGHLQHHLRDDRRRDATDARHRTAQAEAECAHWCRVHLKRNAEAIAILVLPLQSKYSLGLITRMDMFTRMDM